MASQRIRVGDANAQQLRVYARDVHNLDVHANSGKDKIVGALQDAGLVPQESPADAFIEIPAAAGPETTAQHPVPAQNLDPAVFGAAMRAPEDVAAAPRYTIMIPKGPPGSVDPIPVGVNGYVISIRRGQKVNIPAQHLEVLQAAIRSDYETDEDGNILPDPVESPEFAVMVYGVAPG